MTQTDNAFLIVGIVFSLVGIPIITAGSYALLSMNGHLMLTIAPLGLLAALFCFLVLGLGAWLDGFCD